MAQRSLLRLPVLFLALSVAHVAGLICYDTSGNEDPDSYPCQPDAEVSLCCAAGNICYSNSLCAPGPQNPTGGLTPYYYGACTDKSTPSPQCKAEAECVSQNSPGNGITACGNGKGYCCYGLGGCSCSNGSTVFDLAGGVVITTLPLHPSTSTSTATNKATSTSAGTTSGADSSSLSSDATVGIGVGVGVGGLLLLVAIGVGVWWCLRQRRKKKEWQGPIPENEPTQWYQMDAKKTPIQQPIQQSRYQDHPQASYGWHANYDGQANYRGQANYEGQAHYGGQLDSHAINELPGGGVHDY